MVFPEQKEQEHSDLLHTDIAMKQGYTATDLGIQNSATVLPVDE